MTSMLKRTSVLAILVAALFVGGACETVTEPIPQTDRIEAEAPDELLGGVFRFLFRTTLTLVETTVKVVEQLGMALIGPLGGVVEVADHALQVPASAVSSPTVFSMRAIEGTTIEVELRARDASTGEDVGEKGFDRPVRLSLSYADANVRDPSTLTIVRIEADGSKTKLKSTVDRENQQVIAELDHFSRYALCRN